MDERSLDPKNGEGGNCDRSLDGPFAERWAAAGELSAALVLQKKPGCLLAYDLARIAGRNCPPNNKIDRILVEAPMTIDECNVHSPWMVTSGCRIIPPTAGKPTPFGRLKITGQALGRQIHAPSLPKRIASTSVW